MGIHVDVRPYYLVERHLDGRRDLGETLYHDLIGGVDVRLTVCSGVEHYVVLQIPVLHHAVYVGFKTFGINDRRVGDRFRSDLVYPVMLLRRREL